MRKATQAMGRATDDGRVMAHSSESISINDKLLIVFQQVLNLPKAVGSKLAQSRIETRAVDK
jgi:hypothetical protein